MVRPPISSGVCLVCKGGRKLCGKPVCPILMKNSILKSISHLDLNKTSRDVDLFGASPPGFFVGREGYPNVRVGPMIPVGGGFKDDPGVLDAPERWFGTSLERIVEYRSSLARSSFELNVKGWTGAREGRGLNLEARRLLDVSQELAMAARPVDVEAHLKTLKISVQFDNHAIPMGPSGLTDKIMIVENTRVHPVVDKVVSDVDLKAAEAVFSKLYMDAKLNVSQIQRVFSAGLLGEKRERKLVPTRWAITAVDDMIGRALVKKIKGHPQVDDFRVFGGEYLDNRFTVLVAPGPWSFEMMEVWAPNTVWNQPVQGVQEAAPSVQIQRDYEFERGRTRYASNVTGAYYAARLAVVEYLNRLRKQGRVVVFREVSGGYLVPLGVWVIRETTREMLEARKATTFDALGPAVEFGLRDLEVPARA
ncbi:MAG: Nre family DNA repair protein [Promethearchaeota archaeon]